MSLRKYFLFTIFVTVIAIATSGCTVWTLSSNSNSSRGSSTFIQDTGDFDTESIHAVVIQADLSICDFSIESHNDDNITYRQTYSDSRIMVAVQSEVKEDTLYLTLSNSDSNFMSFTKSCTFDLFIPEDIEVSVNSQTDVGNQSLNFKEIPVTALDIRSDVGDIELFANDTEALESISILSNVGNVDARFEGDLEALDTLNAETDVGDLFLKVISEDDTNAQMTLISDVGNITFESQGLSGNLDVDFDKFTGNFTFDGQELEEGGRYAFGAQGGDASVSIGTDVGDIEFTFLP
jgi:hypothetical protein